MNESKCQKCHIKDCPMDDTCNAPIKKYCPKLVHESKQGWREAFRKKFVINNNLEEHAIVAYYDDEDGFDYWNAYKLEAFIDQTIREREEGLRGKIEALMTPEMGHWQVPESELINLARENGRNSAFRQVLTLLSDSEKNM